MLFPVSIVIDGKQISTTMTVSIPSEYQNKDFVLESVSDGHINFKTVDIDADIAKPIDNCDMTYLVRAGNTRKYKIGHTTKLSKRLSVMQTSNPKPLRVTSLSPGGIPFEDELHEKYKKQRISGEWFVLEKYQATEIKIEMMKRRREMIPRKPRPVAPPLTENLKPSNCELTPSQLETLSKIMSILDSDSFEEWSDEPDFIEEKEKQEELPEISIPVLQQSPETNNVLRMENRKITHDLVYEIIDSIKQNKNFNTLSLVNCKISVRVMSRLADALSVTPQIKHINFSNNNFSITTTKLLSTRLLTSNNLYTIILSNNKICTEGARSLIRSLALNPNIRKLDLSNNSFGFISSEYKSVEGRLVQ